MPETAAPHSAQPVKPSRLFAPDALRGTMVVLMALDHANHFVANKHPPGEMWDGVFPVYYEPLTFITRLVTHLAAPGFFLLMGIGMALFARSRRARGWSRWKIIRHFWMRGAVLILLQLLVVNRAWELSPGGWGIRIYVGVLCALGGSMILGSLLVWLKPVHLLALAAALLVGVEFTHPGLRMWDKVSHAPPYVIWLWPGGTQFLYALYPILPWLELVALGLAFGHWLTESPPKAYRRARRLGLALLATFVLVRALDGFGNVRPGMGNTWIDFLNPVKYPPSIAFTTMTTGVNLILLWAYSRLSKRARYLLRPLTALGRTPLLFYVLHLFLYLGIGRLFAPQGTTIPWMVPFWLMGLVILLPLCAWYGGLKQRQPLHSAVRVL
jgi:uncharacterized membrane protein